MNAFLMYRLYESQTCIAPLSFSFVQLLQLTEEFSFSEEHDRIYGLIGLKTTDFVAAAIKPNYGMKIHELYESIARLILEHDHSLALLSVRPSSTPTWIPQWAGWGRATGRNLRPTYAHREFKCASTVARNIRYPNDKPELEVRGIVVEKVDTVSEPVMGTVISRRALQTLLRKVCWSKGSMENFAMTLTSGKDRNGYPVDDINSHMEDCFSALLSHMLALNDLHTLLPMPEPTKPPLQITDVETLAENGDPTRYQEAMKKVSDRYTIFKTQSGRIGTGPWNSMKEGDSLCVFFGADVPFIVRPKPKRDGYKLVGECYIYDLMHGEIHDQLSNPASQGELKEEWIKLI